MALLSLFPHTEPQRGSGRAETCLTMRALPKSVAACNGVPPPTSLLSFMLTFGWKDSTCGAARPVSPAAALRLLLLSCKSGNLGQETGGSSDSACAVAFDRIAPLSCAACASRVADRYPDGGRTRYTLPLAEDSRAQLRANRPPRVRQRTGRGAHTRSSMRQSPVRTATCVRLEPLVLVAFTFPSIISNSRARSTLQRCQCGGSVRVAGACHASAKTVRAPARRQRRSKGSGLRASCQGRR